MTGECARCGQTTEVTLRIEHRPLTDMRMLCTDCGSALPEIPIRREPQVQDNQQDDNKQPEDAKALPDDKVESEANLPTTADEQPPAGMTEAAKRQEQVNREEES